MKPQYKTLIHRLNDQEYNEMVQIIDLFTTYIQQSINYQFLYQHDDWFFDSFETYCSISCEEIRNALEFISDMSAKYGCSLGFDPFNMDDHQMQVFIGKFIHNLYSSFLKDYCKSISDSEDASPSEQTNPNTSKYLNGKEVTAE